VLPRRTLLVVTHLLDGSADRIALAAREAIFAGLVFLIVWAALAIALAAATKL
jgi:hypothetical protein